MEMLPTPGLGYTVAVFAIVIGFLVFVHEYGHYGMARLFGIKVDTFAVGFGPEIIGRTDKNGTRWKLGLIPLGGYAKFAGDADEASQPDHEALARMGPLEQRELFHFRPLWQKALVVAAGPLINFVLAIAIFAAFNMIYGQQVTAPVVSKVMENSAAAQAGLQVGDRFLMADGQEITAFEDLVQVVTINTGKPIEVEIVRDGRPMTLMVHPKVEPGTDRFGNSYKQARLGVYSGQKEVVQLGVFASIGAAFGETWDIVRMMSKTILQLFMGERDVKEMGGPVKIAQYSGQSATLGVPALISFMALVSINLGFINLLPIPMLDGGHLFLYAVEAVRKQPLNPKIQGWAFMSGFALLMSLTVFLTLQDLNSVGLWDKLANLIS